MSLPELYAQQDHYKGILEKIVLEMSAAPELHNRHLPAMSNAQTLRQHTEVLRSKDHKSASLIFSHDNQPVEASEEVVFHIQGYVVHANLPPILRTSQLSTNSLQAKQSITLSGLGDPAFANAVLAIANIQQHLKQTSIARQMQQINIRRERGFPVLTFANRYFADSDNPEAHMDSIPIDDVLDPVKLLRNASPQGIHTSNNSVLYFERLKASNGTLEYLPISPSLIKLGQLVEVQCSFITVAARRDTEVMLMKLRSICILDRTVEQDHNESLLQRILSVDSTSATAPPSLKRQIGYHTEDGMDMDLKRLRLNQNSSST